MKGILYLARQFDNLDLVGALEWWQPATDVGDFALHYAFDFCPFKIWKSRFKVSRIVRKKWESWNLVAVILDKCPKVLILAAPAKVTATEIFDHCLAV